MAKKQTVLGKVSLTPQGTYDPSKTYEQLDIIEYNGSSYLVLKSFKGIEPVGDNKYTMILAGKGEAGKSLSILGRFNTLEELKTTVTNPEPGDMYGVLADTDSSMHVIYIYDGKQQEWVNFGKLENTAGKSAYEAYLEAGGELSEEEFNESLQHIKDIRPKENILDIFDLLTSDPNNKIDLDFNRILEIYEKVSTHDLVYYQNFPLGIIYPLSIIQIENYLVLGCLVQNSFFNIELFLDERNEKATGIIYESKYIDVHSDQTIQGKKDFLEPISIKGNQVLTDRDLKIQEIKKGEDLNKYSQTGIYVCREITIAETLLNSPTSFTFSMFVENISENSFKQTITQNIPDSSKTWIRNVCDNEFGEWVEVLTSNHMKIQEITEEGDDLNNYTEPGLYFCQNLSVIYSLKNCPIDKKFILSVEALPEDSIIKSCSQTLTVVVASQCQRYLRCSTATIWEKWHQLITDKNISDYIHNIPTTDLVTKSGDEIITGEKTFEGDIYIKLEDQERFGVFEAYMEVVWYMMMGFEMMGEKFDELDKRIEILEKGNS